jgi:hypothetical protein
VLGRLKQKVYPSFHNPNRAVWQAVTRHGSIQFALPVPGAATHTHAESPTTQVSPIALPDTGNMSVDGNLPFSRASTSSPYGIITGRSSPICHCGRRTRTARGGGSFTSVACGAVAPFQARACQPPRVPESEGETQFEQAFRSKSVPGSQQSAASHAGREALLPVPRSLTQTQWHPPATKCSGQGIPAGQVYEAAVAW